MQPDQLLNGRYRLTEVIGAGGMSVVWRAHDEVLGRTVAVKVLAPPHDADDPLRGDMLAEARSAAMLSHPNLTNVFDYGESVDAAGQSVPFVVMELLSGPTLASRLADAPLPPREALTICAQIASAVAAAHAQGVVHRDIKPSNVILTAAGPKVLDFGIAAFVGAPDLEPSGYLVGTASYLAPERLDGEGVSPAADVFAVGVLIYRVLTGELPWSTETPAQALLAHRTVEPRPLPAAAGVPWEVHDLYRHCLAKDPAFRPTAAEVAETLTAAIADRTAPNGADEPATLAFPAGPAVKRRRRRLAVPAAVASAAVLAVLAVVLAASASGGGDNRAGPAPTSPAETGASDTGAASPTPGPTLQPVETIAPVALPPTRSPGRGPRTTPNGTPSTTSTGPATEAVTALGGTIHVLCQGDNATLLGIQPATGYAVHDQVGGPAHEVKVVLRSSEHQSEIKAKCGPEGILPEIKESER